MISRFLALGAAAALLTAAEPPTPALTALLRQTQDLAPAEALARLDAWTGPDHPLRQVALGQQRLRHLDQPGADAVALRTAAAAAFTAALASDPTLRPAHLGLARLAAQQEDWPTARRHAAAGIDPSTADASQLIFLADTARRASDHRLATLAAQTGVLRFPEDATLRRLELATLVDAGRAEDARQAVLALLAQAPTDTTLWRHLAWAAQTTHRPDEALAALEAALATAPTDAALRRQVGEQFLAAALPAAALTTLAPLIDPASSPPDLLLLATRAAEDAGDLARARAWLAAVPSDRRTRDLTLHEARLAVAAGDPAAARTALDLLVAAGATDPVLLTWAGSLAAQTGDPARAEVLLRGAAEADHPPASLHLAALLLRQDRADDAREVVRALVSRHPEHPQAQALLAHLGATAP